MRLLILTDHGGHTAHNSLYALARALHADARVREIRVASRATPANADFFACRAGAAAVLQALTVGSDFGFRSADAGFSDSETLRHTPAAWCDAVFLRLPHPVPDGWFGHLRKTFGRRPIVNAPEGIAVTTSKAWLLNVPELCAPMRLCERPRDVVAFVRDPNERAEPRDAVLKPLRGYGGQGILRVRDGRVEVGEERVALGDWPDHPAARRAYLAVEYTPFVREGDKRIVVVDGEVLGAVLRVPAPGAWLCNVSQGGHAEPSTLTPAEERIVATLDGRMRRLGVVMYGIDTLVGRDRRRVLSEVNTMSIGGLNDLPAAGARGTPAAERAARLLIGKLVAGSVAGATASPTPRGYAS